jgi:hypothetical protein
LCVAHTSAWLYIIILVVTVGLSAYCRHRRRQAAALRVHKAPLLAGNY